MLEWPLSPLTTSMRPLDVRLARRFRHRSDTIGIRREASPASTLEDVTSTRPGLPTDEPARRVPAAVVVGVAVPGGAGAPVEAGVPTVATASLAAGGDDDDEDEASFALTAAPLAEAEAARPYAAGKCCVYHLRILARWGASGGGALSPSSTSSS